MQIQEIKELMDKMCQTGINILEIEGDGSRLHLERTGTVQNTSAVSQDTRPVAAEVPEVPVVVEVQGHLVVSPVIGVFYAAPTPDSDPFVTVGADVEVGSPLCIIEAMKLMNEVTSAWDGVVLEIMVESGQRVEFGQPIMRIGDR